MTFSVIIPFYNDEELLLSTLKSIQNQHTQPKEIILSDDGSAIDLTNIFRLAESMKPAVIYVRQEDKGFRAARCRNNGIRLANSDYLIFNDQDIIGSVDYYTQFIRHARRGEFLVAYPVRLTPEQTEEVRKLLNNGNRIDSNNFPLPAQQRSKVRDQFSKERFYYILKKFLNERGYHPKLRGGVFGIFRDDIMLVNGFDEDYQDWGYEDDDLGRRLNRTGIIGKNVFKNEYPLHQYHPSLAKDFRGSNKEYYHKRQQEISEGLFRVEKGILSNDDHQDLEVIHIKDETV